MKLVMTDIELSLVEIDKVVKEVGANYDINIRERLSLKNLKEKLHNIRKHDCVYITSDERALILVPDVFEIDDIYIYKNSNIKPIRECTNKELRNAHNLFNMYLAGAFD